MVMMKFSVIWYNSISIFTTIQALLFTNPSCFQRRNTLLIRHDHLSTNCNSPQSYTTSFPPLRSILGRTSSETETEDSSQLKKQSNNRFKTIIKNIINLNKRFTLFRSKRATATKKSKYLQQNQQLGKLILVRSAESRWKTSGADGKFAGWTDVGLSINGAKDIEYTGNLLREYGYKVDVAYCSQMKRAIESTAILLRELKQVFRPVIKSYRLNGRMYGGLEGLSKKALEDVIGHDAMEAIRTNLDWRPPPLAVDHPHMHRYERRFIDSIPHHAMPLTESLRDTLLRSSELWTSDILPDILAGKNVLIVGHEDSLKGIIQQIDQLSLRELQDLLLPNCLPLMYTFERVDHTTTDATTETETGSKTESVVQQNTMTSSPSSSSTSATVTATTAATVDDDNTKSALKNRRLFEPFLPLNFDYLYNNDDNSVDIAFTHYSTSSDINGNNGGNLFNKKQIIRSTRPAVSSLNSNTTPKNVLPPTASNSPLFTGTFLQSRSFPELFLNAYKKSSSSSRNTYSSSSSSTIITQPQSQITTQIYPTDSQSNVYAPSLILHNITDILETFIKNYTKTYKPTSRNSPLLKNQTRPSFDTSSPFVVIIRHGKTEYNKLGLFTGWEDAQLTAEGRVEATRAGELLRRHGIKFDIVYTSWLTRAIETSWHVLFAMDEHWLPIIKTWRLNERMYGALTGLSKKMVGQQYGEELMQQWRHSYDTPPPPLTSFSPYYPGNDERYVKYVKDIPISIFETVIRSLANRKFELHYRLPKTESLKDSMDRTIPYFKNIIYPESVAKGKRVLIASSENAIRGLLMHLCDIPSDKISDIEIPTGLPMVYDFHTKCVKLLDDGLYQYTTSDSATDYTGSDSSGSSGHNDRDSSVVKIDPLKRYYFGKNPEYLFKPRATAVATATSTNSGSTTSSSSSSSSNDDGDDDVNQDILIRLPQLADNVYDIDSSSSSSVYLTNDDDTTTTTTANTNTADAQEPSPEMTFTDTNYIITRGSSSMTQVDATTTTDNDSFDIDDSDGNNNNNNDTDDGTSTDGGEYEDKYYTQSSEQSSSHTSDITAFQ